jgi:glycosyltransferase involved in cell wall biosynthesis
MRTPAVSVVVATYNRADVLRFTIEAAIRSSFSDWEMIVVGDACTDHSAAIVASFKDPRISFVNLPVNAGEQSVPNNEGVRRARGRYVAFLNHDDLWATDHLQIALEAIEREAADFVSTLTICISATGEPSLAGSCAPQEYAPYAFVPASSWLVRRDCFEVVGPWRRAQSQYMFPSQEWLLRARRRGLKLLSVRRATVLAILSGDRRNSYVTDQSEEQERWARRLRDDPGLFEELLTDISARQADEQGRPAVWPHLRRAARKAVVKVAFAVGGHPTALRNAVLYWRRGGSIDSLRRTRGLPPLERLGGRDDR